jgi:hypothetical protein
MACSRLPQLIRDHEVTCTTTATHAYSEGFWRLLMESDGVGMCRFQNKNEKDHASCDRRLKEPCHLSEMAIFSAACEVRNPTRIHHDQRRQFRFHRARCRTRRRFRVDLRPLDRTCMR